MTTKDTNFQADTEFQQCPRPETTAKQLHDAAVSEHTIMSSILSDKWSLEEITGEEQQVWT